MSTFTIQSREHGYVEFRCRDTGGYVFVTCKSLSLSNAQLCENGGLMGSTLSASEKTLEKVARRWWKRYSLAPITD